MSSLNPDRPEIIGLLDAAASMSVDECTKLVRRYMRTQHHAADAAAVAASVIQGRRTSDAAERAERIAAARRALDRVHGIMRHVPEEIREGEYIVPLRAIAEQAVFQAVQALLAAEAMPPRLMRVLLGPFEGIVDGIPETAGTPVAGAAAIRQ
jgi:hypothetical protein